MRECWLPLAFVNSVCYRVRWAWRNLAFHYLKTGKYALATPAFYNALRSEPKDSKCWKGLSQSYLAAGAYCLYPLPFHS